MNTRTLRWTALAGIFFISQLPANLTAQTEPIEPDAAAVEVINALIQALGMEDEAARTQALLPLLHPVLLTPDGTDIVRNMKMIIGRSLADMQGFVAPAEFEKVERVGGGHRFGSLEVDTVDRYYAKKGDGSSSMIPIVWSSVGGGPKVVGIPR